MNHSQMIGHQLRRKAVEYCLTLTMDTILVEVSRIHGKVSLKPGSIARKGTIQFFLPKGSYTARIRLSHVVWSGRDKLVAKIACSEGATLLLKDTLHYEWSKTKEDKVWLYGENRFRLTGGLEVEHGFNADQRKLITFYRSF